MMQRRQPQRDSDARPASQALARLTGTVVLAATAVAVTLAAAPAAAWPQAAAQTSTISAAQINCPPPNPEATPQTGGISDC
jgi:hypothetical protein